MVDQKRPETSGSDAIDRFAAEILQYPERADALKAGLRHSLGVAAANSSAPARRRACTTVAAAAADLEDFWDNVPV